MPDLTRAEVEQIKAMLPTLLHPAISLSSAAKFEALCNFWLTMESRVRELEAELEKASTIILNLVPLEPITQEDIAWAQDKLQED